VAHGRILGIDTAAAEAMDGVEAVFTGAQIAEILGPMPIGTPAPSPEHRAVAVDTVRYTGEPVAVVVARDRYVARDAAEAIEVTYDTLPAVVDPEAAMTGKPAVLHADFPNNIALLVPSGTGVTGSGNSRKIDDSPSKTRSRRPRSSSRSAWSTSGSRPRPWSPEAWSRTSSLARVR
jgi:CO/xanthine dehydrogenase Mo-binding subunit